MACIGSSIRRIVCTVPAVALLLCPQISRADESGISFWVPGLFGSLAAVPQTPGWSLGTVYYHTSVAASGAAAAAREIQVGRFSPNVNVNLNLSLKGFKSLEVKVNGTRSNNTTSGHTGHCFLTFSQKGT